MAKTKKLTKREINVAVAKDVLKWIDGAKVQEGKCYLGARGYLFGDEKEQKIRQQAENVIHKFDGNPEKIQVNIPRIAKHCVMCASGAMFLAHIHLFDGVYAFNFELNSQAEDGSKRIFGDHAIAVESAFENPKDPKLAVLKPKERLKAIMRQVIRQGGAFKENVPKVKKVKELV